MKKSNAFLNTAQAKSETACRRSVSTSNKKVLIRRIRTLTYQFINAKMCISCQKQINVIKFIYRHKKSRFGERLGVNRHI